ncbi:hypothetical protein G6F40_014068 [Rhizopus arrhizus]|nr:hypothetical protein G6F40_014068 [Rhizopus arrhizus]
MRTGKVEVIATAITVLNKAAPLPFHAHENPGEETRLKYRYLALRRPEMQRMQRTRIKLVQALRRHLDEKGFQDIETPILTKATPEGARDFLVPARMHPGEVYALPQSPQLFKQILMVAGFDRYYQIARCFRDEALLRLRPRAGRAGLRRVDDPRHLQGSGRRRAGRHLPAHDLGRSHAPLRLGQAGPAHRAGTGRCGRTGQGQRVPGVHRPGQ